MDVLLFCVKWHLRVRAIIEEQFSYYVSSGLFAFVPSDLGSIPPPISTSAVTVGQLGAFRKRRHMEQQSIQVTPSWTICSIDCCIRTISRLLNNRCSEESAVPSTAFDFLWVCISCCCCVDHWFVLLHIYSYSRWLACLLKALLNCVLIRTVPRKLYAPISGACLSLRVLCSVTALQPRPFNIHWHSHLHFAVRWHGW
jgi:hypothetical protein